MAESLSILILTGDSRANTKLIIQSKNKLKSLLMSSIMISHHKMANFLSILSFMKLNRLKLFKRIQHIKLDNRLILDVSAFDFERKIPFVKNDENILVIMNENIKLDKLEFAATSCTVSAGDFSFQIWDYSDLDQCLPDKYIGFTRYPTTDAFAKFSYEGFQFRPDGGSAPAEQTISCAVKVCHEDDESSACKNGCYGV